MDSKLIGKRTWRLTMTLQNKCTSKTYCDKSVLTIRLEPKWLRMDSRVILGALARGRSKSRRLAPLVRKFNSLMVAASFTPLLVYCQTDLNLADEPSRHG